MQWYSHLYTGKKAEQYKKDIVQGICDERLQPEVYVITSRRTNRISVIFILLPCSLFHPKRKKAHDPWHCDHLLGGFGGSAQDGR